MAVVLIRTSRLRLRTPAAGDLEPLLQLWLDPEVLRRMGGYGPRSPAEVRDWLDRQAAVTAPADRDGSLNLVSTRREDGALVGWFGIGVDHRGVAEWNFGYAAHPCHRGRGYTAEGLRGLLHHCVDVIGVASIWGQCDRDNLASAGVMISAGMIEIEPTQENRRFLYPGSAADSPDHQQV